MRDVVFVAITVGFFALAGLFLRGCARIVGPDDAALSHDDRSPDDSEATESSPSMKVVRS